MMGEMVSGENKVEGMGANWMGGEMVLERGGKMF